ncbi:MAG: DUF2807 domain-containing protein [Prevotella sp.]|nr:DUF2807 domain-containing protein [Prevotella sp.]
MKKAVLLIVCGMMVLTACRFNWNGLETIKPSDNIVKKEYKLDKFTEVAIHVFAQVKIVHDEAKDGLVVFSAPDNYIDLFSFESKDETLDIKFAKDNVNIEGKNVKITVYTADLLKIDNSGAATVSLDKLDTDTLEVVNSGVGSFSLKMILADKVYVRCSGVGDITIDGETLDAELSCSGVGNIDAKQLKARNVKASVTGVGGISCYASEYIDGKVTGVGGLKYAGHPKKKNLGKHLTGGISEI